MQFLIDNVNGHDKNDVYKTKVAKKKEGKSSW